MKSLVRNITGFFFLLVFLFPLVEKGLHDFSHRNDFHCAEKADKHFHSEEHSCSLCDFHLTSSNDTPVTDFTFVPTTTAQLLALPVQEEILSSYFHRLSSRGPPALG
jgi:hypothetical protein